MKITDIKNKFFNKQWGLKLINAEGAWKLLNNGGMDLTGNLGEKAFGSPEIKIVTVDQGIETIKSNVLDGGIERIKYLPTHKSFSGTTNGGQDKLIMNIVLEDEFKFSSKDYLNGPHGMQVSGIATAKAEIGSSSYNGAGIIGVAPNCSFYSVTYGSSLTTGNATISIIQSLIGLAGIDTSTYNPTQLRAAYNITDKNFNICSYYQSESGFSLASALQQYYADIFNLSFGQPTDLDIANDNYPKVIFNEVSFFGRKGRGSVSVVAAGNDGVNLESAPNPFGNELAYSNKPIIVGAVSVNNNYDWTTNKPPANARKSNYSNYGNRIDICAPGGDEYQGGVFISPKLQDKNRIYTTTTKGTGEFWANSPIKLTLNKKQKIGDDVYLEFNNTDGVYIEQDVFLENNYENLYKVKELYGGTMTLGFTDEKTNIPITVNKGTIRIGKMNGDVYSNLDTSGSSRSVFEFSPICTKIITVLPNKVIEVESTNGAFTTEGLEKIYIGGLGDGPNDGKKITIKKVDPSNKQITLGSDAEPKVGDYVVFPPKIVNIVPSSITNSDSLIVPNNNGFFVGGVVAISDGINLEGLTIKSIAPNPGNESNSIITFTSLVTITNPQVIKNINTGDICTTFKGTSAATPFVSGAAALVLSANKNLSSAEVKHILKETASSTLTVSNAPDPNNPGNTIPSYASNDEQYEHNIHYGTGLLDAEAAVDLALKWHSGDQYPSTLWEVLKPRLEIADKSGGTGIWVKPLSEPSLPIPENSEIVSTIDRNIYVKVKNTGNRQSFKECDLRVLVAFTDEANPTFPFPISWYDQKDVKLLSVKEIPIIPAGGEVTIAVEWRNIADNWNVWNPQRKKAYILAHIAPFDGLPEDVDTTDISRNKQLGCKGVTVVHTEMKNGTSSIPGDKLSLTVGAEAVAKNFNLSMENVSTADLDTLQIKAMKTNSDGSLETVIYKKTDDNWALDSSPSGDWIKFEPPVIAATDDPLYANVVFPHTLTVSDDAKEVKLETVTVNPIDPIG